MKKPRILLASILLACHSVGLESVAEPKPLQIQEQDVIALLGAENMVRAQQAGQLETLLTATFHESHIRFRDMAWEGDTVSVQTTIHERWREDKYGDWPQQLNHVGATTVWAQFGKMESLSGEPGLDAFIQNYEQLILSWKQAVDRITLITPIAFESTGSSHQPDLLARNTDLARYVKAIQDLAHKHELAYLDLFHPSLASQKTGDRLTKNGLHILPKTQPHYANLFLTAAGVQAAAAPDGLRAAGIEKHRLWFEYWRPANWKCLFGDDGERIFGEAAGIYPTFREEWKRYPALIKQAESRISQIAQGVPLTKAINIAPNLTGWSQTRPPTAPLPPALAAFEVLDGFEVNLFASEAEGLVNPLALRWDSTGQLFVACTVAYPQHEPGEIPNDFIVVLKDTTGDGVADASHVFAEGLNIPTGIEIAPNGVYVGQGTQLLLLQDTDGDGVADHREVVLSGFGNGDTHQTSNSFVWSPGGQLYWCQGDGIESRVETPWGVSRLFQAGVYRLRPERMQLEGLLDDFMGPGNPWGIAFDDWGQPIVIDGAGGVTHLGPALIPSPYRLRLPTIGRPGGYSGIDVAAHPALPIEMQGDFVIGDYKPNSVSRFALQKDGASYDVIWKAPLLTSADEYFRPVDVKMGPDGAIYVCDWYNTVICHQDDSYRHTARDKGHGRIWRVAPTNRPRVRTPSLAATPTDALIRNLDAPNRWLREQSKRQLVTREREPVIQALDSWVASIPSDKPNTPFQHVQGLMMSATLERVDERLLKLCLASKDPRARAFAARTVGRWHDRLPNPLSLLEPLTRDPDPQVRMEVVLSCGNIPHSRSVVVAARATRLPTDRWIDYAFTQTVRFLEPFWMPPLTAGTLDFHQNTQDLIRVIQAARSKEISKNVRQLATSKTIDSRNQMAARHVLASIGDEHDLLYLLDKKNFRSGSAHHARAHTEVLQTITESKRPRPQADLTPYFDALFNHQNHSITSTALRLAAHWKVNGIHQKVKNLAIPGNEDSLLRRTAIECLPSVQSKPDPTPLLSLVTANQPAEIQKAAITALTKLDLAKAASIAIQRWHQGESFAFDDRLVRAFLSRRGGDSALARAIESIELSSVKAQSLLNTLVSHGHSDPGLTQVLREIAGFSSAIPNYSQAYVDALGVEIQRNGNPHSGERVFRSAAANCYSCHQIAGVGQALGPDLSNAGTGIPIARLIEEVVWPTRHVKEGYALTQVTTTEDQVLQGYERKERNQADSLILEEFGTKNRIRIAKNEIQEREEIGSIMPPTAVSLLTRPQLRDLIRFLSELGSPGEFSARDRETIRSWEAASESDQVSSLDWIPVTTRVSGNLDLSDVQTAINRQGRFWLRTEFNTDSDESERLRVNHGKGLRLWIDDQPIQESERPSVRISPGDHQLKILVDPQVRGDMPIHARW